MELNSDNDKIIKLVNNIELADFVPNDDTRFFLEQQITLAKRMKNTRIIDYVEESEMPSISPIVPNVIKTYIAEAPIKKIYKFVLRIGQRTVNIIITFFRKIVKPLLLQFIIKKIELWLLIAFHYAPAQCSNILNVQIYMTDIKKTLPVNGGVPIEPEHANTAFTTGCNVETNIVLFRREEWFKVFIHETFHCLGLDFSDHIDTGKQTLLHVFNIKSDMRLFETYCEMWADTMNLIVCNVLDYDKFNVRKIMNLTCKQLNIERGFAMFQAAKVLRHYNTTYSELFNKDTPPKFVEKTEVFSYYVLRSLLMFDLNRFYNWCLRNNQGSLAFINPAINVPRFVKNLDLHNKDYIDTLNDIDVRKLGRGCKFVRETMRMTAL